MSHIKNFDTLTVEAQEAIMKVAVFRHFDAGQVIYIEGEPPTFVSSWKRAGLRRPA